MSYDAPISTLRLALRASLGFGLDVLQLYRGDRTFTDALIVATLIQCNSASVAGDVDLRRRYAAFETPPPADLRRPISVNALASSLGLPFETVRRRTKQMLAEGVCEATPHGIRFSDRVVAAEGSRILLDRCYELARALYERLKRAGCVQLMELPPFAPAALPNNAPPVRIVWRTTADYFLRMMELLLPKFDSLTRAFILLEIARVNTQGMSDALRGDDGFEAEAFVPDSYRRPARASDIAAQLGLPHETVRRNLQPLLADMRCQRVRDGYIVPAAVLARPAMAEAWTANFRNLNRMFGELAETGVLTLWDAERSAAEHAA